MSTVDEAAVLLLALGENEAAKILKHLEPREVQRLGTAIADLENLPTDRIETALNVFLESVSDQTGLALGSDRYLDGLLRHALGDERAQVIMERILGGNTSGLDKLRWMEPRTIAEFVQQENAQVQAIVLSYLDPDQAAAVLTFIPDVGQRRDIISRVAQLESVSPAALNELSLVLEEQVDRTKNRRYAELGGRKAAADILNHVAPADNESILNEIKAENAELSEEIQEMMFVFENLMLVDDRGIQTLLREISTELLVVGLKGADEVLRDKIFGNMSKRAAELLQDDMEAKGPVRLSDVETAQKEILTTARSLAESGEIVLGGGGGEMV
ncbi:MAG: flagellar motor switch protein FliG [Pseudomonadota bacterium]